MKNFLRILRIISTVIGAIVLSFLVIGMIVWGIDLDNIRYGRDELISGKNLENEGPFIFEHDSIYQITYIKGNAETGYFSKHENEKIRAGISTSCYYYPDSTSFAFKLKHNLQNEKSEYEKPEKIIAISDIESNYKTFRNFLIGNKVIDEKLNWIFGKGHLVLNGDFIDRSYFTTQVLWFIYKLEQEAMENGGKVHFILGNHEIMNIQGDHRYAKNKYKTIASILELKQHQLYDTTLYLGKWLQTKNIVEKIGDYIFVHGGLSTDLADKQVELAVINRIAKANYQIAYFPKQNQSLTDKSILNSKTSPYWYRGYFDNELTQSEIDKILNFYDGSQIIVGHTIQEEVNRIYNGKIVAIDVKHPKDYYQYFPTLRAQGLLIEKDKFFRIDNEGSKIEI